MKTNQDIKFQSSQLLKWILATMVMASNSLIAEIDTNYQPLDNSIEFREMMGHLLSQQDWVAEVGTDSLIALGADLRHKKLTGFIVENKETHWTLSYVGKRKFSEGIYYQIDVTTDGPNQSTYKDYSNKPLKFSDFQKAIYQAIQTSKNQKHMLCSHVYNPVVLPMTFGDTPYLFTYLLAASNQADVTVMGGHHRYIVSNNGKKLIQYNAHTNTCLNYQKAEKAEALVVSHINDDIPNEFHIYMSYLYDQPIYVATVNTNSMWKVFEGKITLIDDDITNDD